MIFTIDYNITLKSGTLLGKQIKVKNKENELIAKCSLEDYLRRKYGNDFIELVVTNCKNTTFGEFGSMSDFFGGIFK